jgi:hypothetical protein
MRHPTSTPPRRGRRRYGPLALGLTAALAATAALLLAPGSVIARSAAAPAVSTPPSISGTAAKDQTVTANSGSWSGTAPITFAFQWLRCDENGSSCGDIGGATSSTYVVGAADVGKRLRVSVTATNADGSSSALSDPTAVVTEGAAPVNTGEPRITGSAVQGQTLTASAGSWSGQAPIGFAYQLVRCGTDGGAADGGNCQVLSGARSATYVLTASDVGSRMRVRVTASNAIGVETAASNPTATVTASTNTGRPVNTAEPRITGTPTAGQTLSAAPGSWTGSQPISLAYQWVRCGTDGGNALGTNCQTIGGATQTTYALTAGDVGRRLRVRVTARNSAGSAVAASNPTATVQASGPAGIITLPNGERSIPASSVPADQRLIVANVQFSPNPVRSRTAPITVRIRVKDTRGYVVRDARVFIRPTPLVTTGADRAATATDGWVTYTLTPRFSFPQPRTGFNVQFFVKAYRVGDPALAGVSGTRLVQVALAG